MEIVPPFGSEQLKTISKILADVVSHAEMSLLLQECKTPDPSPDLSKPKRLFNAFAELQNERQFGNHVVVFINKVMNPVQYTSDPTLFDHRRERLNMVLAFSGLHVSEGGKVCRVPKASNLQEAMERASRLHAALVNRNVHADVLRFCRAEFLQENYFHAVFEAMKSIAAKIRELSGLSADGAQVVEQAFGLGKSGVPILAINKLATETDKGEQRGLANLLIGLFGTIRNPVAHNPKIEWDMNEQDALDILTIASLVHRKLDNCHRHTRE
ncbi:MAG: TIGR02391 family protein [Syntrophobacteraceae bacterium]